MPRFYVHRYDVVRIKVAVDAADQAEAMTAADNFLESSYIARSLTHEWIGPEFEGLVEAPILIQMEPAEETTGYLVDEAGDPEYLKTRSYDADKIPDDHRDRDGWSNKLDDAPAAVCVFAAHHNLQHGDWVVSVELTPLAFPYTHWKMLDVPLLP